MGGMRTTMGQQVDMDGLIKAMIRRGVHETSCPEGMSEGDFEQLRDIMSRVNEGYYQDSALRLMWKPNERALKGERMIDLLKRGDYEGAFGYLLWVSDFIPT